MSEVRTVESAVASTLEQGARKTWRIPSYHTFAVVLMVVFFLVMMICLTAGVSMYRSVASMKSQSDTLHLESGLMTSIVHMGDSAQAVSKADGPEGEALVLVERLASGTYETRLYHYQGAVVQEYAIAGHDINPENAITIVDSGTFEFSYQDGLLTLVTDDGPFHVALRSDQGSASLASAGYSAADAASAGQTGSAGEA